MNGFKFNKYFHLHCNTQIYMIGGSHWLLRTSGTFGSVFVIKKLLIISRTVKCTSWELTINVQNVFFSNGHMTIFAIPKKYLFLCVPFEIT